MRVAPYRVSVFTSRNATTGLTPILSNGINPAQKTIISRSRSTMSDFPPPALRQAAEDVASLLRERKETISVAETAAGGLVSAALLSTPGASRIYKGGLTLYTLDSRIAFAGWTQANIDNYDGPTPKLVEGLASHVRETLKSNYTVGEVCFPIIASNFSIS